MTVIEYCEEEVQRQGHDTAALDGIERVGWMLDGWSYALRHCFERPTLHDVIEIGKLVERVKNKKGIRECHVRVGNRICPSPEDVTYLLFDLFEQRDELKPWDFYRKLLEVHPFEDGNGRSSKIVVAWLSGTLLSPVFPPDDFWGYPIRNP